MTQYNLRKKYQIAFRRWLTDHAVGSTITPYIGADLAFVREWISYRMLPEMNWSNYGQIWVVDHIAPVRLFDFLNNEDLELVLHYKNLMPLLKRDNLHKEGAIDFSIKILELIPSCKVVEKLLSRLYIENKRLHQYLPDVVDMHRKYGKISTLVEI